MKQLLEQPGPPDQPWDQALDAARRRNLLPPFQRPPSTPEIGEFTIEFWISPFSGDLRHGGRQETARTVQSFMESLQM
jgi:hypothetical protein